MKNIERPIKDIKIYSISNIQIEERKLNDVVLDSIEDVKKVTGDFRQEEIINKWNNLLNKNKDVLIVSFNIQVSSGTYIRGLTEEVEKHIGVPVVLYKLVRTQIL
jgi:tRNA U55 pseudouridine synthase TruB